MPTFTFRRTKACAGGNHHDIEVSDGTNARTLHVDTTELRSAVTEEEMQAAFKVLCRAALRGLSPAQAVAKVTSGFTVVVN